MEQFAHRDEGIRLWNRTMAVHCAVSERVDHTRLAENCLAGRLPEGRLVNQRGKVVLIRKLERGIELECPIHRQLQRSPGVEAGGSCIEVNRGLRFRSRVQ